MPDQNILQDKLDSDIREYQNLPYRKLTCDTDITIIAIDMKAILTLIAVSCLFLLSCDKQTRFTLLSSAETGIQFNNTITENDSVNPIDLEFLYNGGGVATGDFNKDGLPDLYFTASTTSNKLYLNKGQFVFEDVTGTANVTGENMWCNGASVIDINNDGYEDIYVCTTIKSFPRERRNLLYINQGKQPDGVPRFVEMAADYGLADTSYSVQAAFLDYDGDGDLDMYLATTKLARRSSAFFSRTDTSHSDYDKLFRNDWSQEKHHPVFTDVSEEAGINHAGFGLGLAIADLNMDGWKDIYVTNDFFGSDHCYLNKGNGTFGEHVRDCFKHTARNAMGNDIADINNDGLADIFSVDMNAESNYRKKKNMNGNNYYEYQNMLLNNTGLQYVRNTMQLNMGSLNSENDSLAKPIFSDISFLTGTAETDWSWNPSLADFDNDGYRDLIVTNGYPRDVTDHDFISFRSKSGSIASKQRLINEIPAIKIANYAFRNNGHLAFNDVTGEWGLNQPSFSNGAIAVDLDRDGDLDYVINNINDEAFVYRNNTNTADHTQKNFIGIAFRGNEKNVNGIGAFAQIYYKDTRQVYENEPCRGYLSCVDSKAFFGVDTASRLDSVVIRWPSRKKQILQNVTVNQWIVADESNARQEDAYNPQDPAVSPLFTDITTTAGIHYIQKKNEYVDFDKERLLPHKLSQYTPALAVADIDANGWDDVFIAGSSTQPGTFLLQQADGTFKNKELPWDASMRNENVGVLLFDADGDGDDDLWCANGSNKYEPGSAFYSDLFYINDGKGNFIHDPLSVPQNTTSKSCIKAADIDNDGDLDVFIGGRCLPGKYPVPVSSFIYRNDSKNGSIRFTDVTDSVCPALKNIGMVCDAIWTDWNNDGRMDLLLAGEWMPLTFLKNVNGKLVDATAGTGVENEKGWWNSLVAGDWDNDGDIDYIAGNLGLNAFIRGNKQQPVKMYVADFDGNGAIDPVLTLWLKDEQGQKHEYTAMNRDDIMNQIPALKKKFNEYKSFASADINQIFTSQQLREAYRLEASTFASCVVVNNGNEQFSLVPLPPEAQLAPLNGMCTGDFNNDGNLDIAITGNDYGNEVTTGQYDAMNGLLMLGNGTGNFSALGLQQSNFYVPGDARGLVTLRSAGKGELLVASQNSGALKAFRKNREVQLQRVNADDVTAYVKLTNGKVRKQEFYWGTSFLSQSTRCIETNPSVKSVEIINNTKARRTLFYH